MIGSYLSGILTRELRALRREVEAYPSDDAVRAAPLGVKNSTASLSMHLCGALQHFVGARLGGSGYVRNRDVEFAGKAVPRSDILREIDATIAIVQRTLPGLSDEALLKPFPDQIGGGTVSTMEFMLHHVAHLGYHLGQIDYHRRITTGSDVTVEVVSPKELPSLVAKS